MEQSLLFLKEEREEFLRKHSGEFRKAITRYEGPSPSATKQVHQETWRQRIEDYLVNVISDSDQAANLPSHRLKDLAYSLIGEIGFDTARQVANDVAKTTASKQESLDQIENEIAERLYEVASNDFDRLLRRVKVKGGTTDKGTQIMRKVGAVEGPTDEDPWGQSFLDSRREMAFEMWRSHLTEVFTDRSIPHKLNGTLELRGSDLWTRIVTKSDWISVKEDPMGVLALWVIDRIPAEKHEEIQQKAIDDVTAESEIESPNEFVERRRRRQAELMVEYIDFSESLIDDDGRPWNNASSSKRFEPSSGRGKVQIRPSASV